MPSHHESENAIDPDGLMNPGKLYPDELLPVGYEADVKGSHYGIRSGDKAGEGCC